MNDPVSAAPGVQRCPVPGLPDMEVWSSLGSTNDRARELAQSGGRRGTSVVALAQTQGRGRRGAAWTSEAGAGMWLSVVLGEGDAFPQLPLVVGLAAAEAVDATTDLRVLLKWPNDLLVGGRKLGGVLVERGAGWIVAGIGVNLSGAPAPSDLDGAAPVTPTSVLAEDGAAPAVRDLAVATVVALLERLDGPEPAGEALSDVRGRDALLGRTVQTEEHGRGIARGIDDDGMLILERDDGSVCSVRSGSVRPADRS